MNTAISTTKRFDDCWKDFFEHLQLVAYLDLEDVTSRWESLVHKCIIDRGGDFFDLNGEEFQTLKFLTKLRLCLIHVQVASNPADYGDRSPEAMVWNAENDMGRFLPNRCAEAAISRQDFELIKPFIAQIARETREELLKKPGGFCYLNIAGARFSKKIRRVFRTGDPPPDLTRMLKAIETSPIPGRHIGRDEIVRDRLLRNR